MSNFKFGLNYNDPPINLDNRQVFDARNITISSDGRSLVTDKGITTIPINLPVGISISDIMTTDKEVIMFCNDDLIRRYNLDTKTTKVCNVEIPLITPIKGVYTYNVKGELIIAITQYSDDGADKLPLKVINLDSPFNHDKLHNINPFKPIANIISSNIINGGSAIRKGSYDFFISYQLDDDNYTDWVSIGSTIYVADIEERVVTSEYHTGYNVGTLGKIYNPVVKRPVNTKYETCNKRIKLNISIDDIQGLYTKFRLAYINNYNNKIESKIIGLYDINDSTIFVSSDYIETISIDELTISNPNIYNVKALTNYNNRLYIGNYEEAPTDELSLQQYADKVYPIWKLKYLSDKSITETKYKCNVSSTDKYAVSLSIERLSNPLSPFNGKDISNDSTRYMLDVLAEDLTAINSIGFNIYGTRYYEVNNGVVTRDELDHPTDHGQTSISCSVKDLRLVISDDKTKPSYLSYVMVDSTLDNSRLYVEIFIPLDTGTYYTVDLSVNTNLINIYNTKVVDNKVNTTRPDHNILINNRSLEPNEVYNFFIHYILDDGSITKGFKINNFGYDNYARMYALKAEPSGSKDSFVVTDSVKQASVANPNFNKYSYANILNENITSTEPAYLYVNNASIRTDNTPTIDGYFGLYINSKNQKLYRCPDYSLFKNKIDTEQYIIDVDFENIDMPVGDYKGVLFSYEKLESIVVNSGLSCNADLDFITKNKDIDSYNKARCVSSELLLNPSLYTGSIINNYGISDQKPLEYLTASVLNPRGRKAFVMSESDNYRYYNLSGYTTLNKTQVIPESDSPNNLGRELHLHSEFNNYNYVNGDNAFVLYQILNPDKAIYTSDVKTLISLGYYRFLSDGSKGNKYNDKNIVLNLPSFNTMDYVYTYNRTGVYYTDTDPSPLSYSDSPYWGEKSLADFNKNGTPYVQVSFNKFSKFYIPAEHIVDSSIKDQYITIKVLSGIAHGDSVYKDTSVLRNTLSPTDSSNVIKLDVSYILTPIKIFDNYNPNSIKSYVFNKSIRRSDVMASESTRNGWRFFRPDNYTVINEQKGDITNLVGIGYYLLCHCERSLFAFSKQSTINADNQAIQLSGVDTFDLPYQEIFTSDKGVCGLQNYFCYCVADGKYYWFDNKQASIYSWDNGSIKLLSKDIDSAFFYGRKSNNSYFNTIWSTSTNELLGSMAYDYTNKRVLINLPSTEDTDHGYTVVFEYSLMLESLLSYHIYPEGSKLYSTYNNVVSFNNVNNRNINVSNNTDYNTNLIGEPYVDIIFTDGTSINKVLNYLTLKSDVTNDIKFVEKVLIYTDNTCTGLIETPIDANWNLGLSSLMLPHYTGESFNFNYLFNVTNNNFENPTVARLDGANIHTNIPTKTRSLLTGEPIHGKWFVVRLVMKPNNYYMINNVELDITKY